LKGKSVVARNELAMFVEIAEIEFSARIILSGGSAQPLKSGLDVGGGRVVSEHGFCKAVFRIGLLRGGLKIGNGSGGILRSWRRLRRGKNETNGSQEQEENQDQAEQKKRAA
jgi:hypothetical protein